MSPDVLHRVFEIRLEGGIPITRLAFEDANEDVARERFDELRAAGAAGVRFELREHHEPDLSLTGRHRRFQRLPAAGR